MDSLAYPPLTNPRLPASAGSQSGTSADRSSSPTAGSRPAQVGRTADVESRGGEQALLPTPRVLILSCEEKKLASLSPFQRKEGCDRFGKVIRCEKLRDGNIEVEFVNEDDARRALSATYFEYSTRDTNGKRLVKLPISVSAHRTKNSSRGIIYCVDLEDVSED